MNPVKTIKWPTNFNQKLICQRFIHVDAAPVERVPLSKLDQLFEIATMDESHPPVKAILSDIYYTPLEKLINMETFASHGMDVYDFIQFYKKKYPTANAETLLAVYLYQKPQE